MKRAKNEGAAQLGNAQFVVWGVKLPFRKLPDKPQRQGFVDEQIDEAIKRGDFDHLQGRGKPLDLRGDLSDKTAMRAKIRADANYSAPWQDVAREIEVATEKTYSGARRAHEFRLAGLRSKKADKSKIESDFQAARREIEAQIAAVNSLILKYNLLVPSLLPHLHRVRLKSADVWEKIAPEIAAELNQKLE
ncbi:protein of unknown function (DUF1992) [Abditibacterium utsteinense]|uniref:DnaJ homologue subfamily C member 28 conserved domain-containing protein n=1 Tax=Abditibacterium utsteinense TaxID=1960156 RepID=A0A2S8SW90_9BACT|nr:DUF1992 domain-containing protein [Abditibacterium utsteinense]PQV65062.1 protein of unknown function (DUF1992) [Abditibacterium utsteinense]